MNAGDRRVLGEENVEVYDFYVELMHCFTALGLFVSAPQCTLTLEQ
jgi:hypothetical protein